MLSPTFLSQVATVPSSIVSDNLGMVMISTPAGNSAAGAASFDSATIGASSALGASVVVEAPPESNPEISSPASPIIAKSVSTGAVSPS